MKDWGTADADMMDRFPEVRERREDGCEHMGDGRVCGACAGVKKIEWAEIG